MTERVVTAAVQERARALWACIDVERLHETALGFLRVPSPTGEEEAFALHLADCLCGLPMAVEMTYPTPNSPNVIARHAFDRPGQTLQFDGHLDTIPMPHAPPQIAEGRLYGRGACDMKGPLACMVEAARILIQHAELCGALMLTAHSLHEAPLGLNQPLDDMIRRGQFGDAVIIGEAASDRLPVAALGMCIWDITVSRQGDVLHESKGTGIPNPLVYANRVLAALSEHAIALARRPGPLKHSLFVGQVHGGDFYNRIPTTCHLQGTRRFPPPLKAADMREEFARLLAFTEAWRAEGISVDVEITRIGDAYQLPEGTAIADCLKAAYAEVHGRTLEEETISLVANAPWFINDAHVPCVYHGLSASSAHADVEWADLGEMVELVKTLVLTAVLYLA